MRTLSFSETNAQFGAVAVSAKLKWLLLAALSAILFLLATQQANALPLFARQTGQNCLACHAGGQYPELTPYGRYFKLTGYTQGTRQDIPVAVSFVGGVANISDNSNGGYNNGTQAVNNGTWGNTQASVYVGGKILDNFGAFSQWTYCWQCASSANQVNTNNLTPNQGFFGADNQDWRYADHYVGDQASTVNDVIWGVSLNNNPGVTDVWNSASAWGYPYMSPMPSRGPMYNGTPTTFMEGYGPGLAGIGGYVFLNKNIYAEIDGYQSATGAASWLAYGSNNSNPNAPKMYVKGTNPYVRLAYQSDEHGAHNWMLGAFGMNSAVYPNSMTMLSPDGTTYNVGFGAPNMSMGTTQYQDRGIDGQYQYLSNPHAVTAQFRMVKENITDNNLLTYSNPTNNLNSFMAKVSYVYDAKYGAALGYQNTSGSNDATYTTTMGSISGSPNTTAWIPSIWWQALQNVRLTYSYTAYTQYGGANQNYDGNGRNASANNTSWLYLWMAM